MKKIRIGQSGVSASQIALGVMRINRLDRKAAADLIAAAYQAGINFFDSADIYGAGRSSMIFGQALRDTGIDRDKIFLQSKGGIILKDGQIDGDGLKGQRYDFSKGHLISTVETELSRLQTDHLDFFLLHRPDTLMRPEEVAEAFSQLEASGKVLHFGVSNFSPYDVDLIQQAVSQKLDVNQLQFGLGHADLIAENIQLNISKSPSFDNHVTAFDVLAYSRLHHMTIQAWSPFQSGFFAGAIVDNPQLPELNAELDKLADKYQVGKNAVASAWIAYHPANIQVILGSMTASRIEDAANIDKVKLTNQEWYDLYLAAGYPLP